MKKRVTVATVRERERERERVAFYTKWKNKK